MQPISQFYFSKYGYSESRLLSTAQEFAKATNELRYGRAVGPDGIPGELLKYGSNILYQQIAGILNQMFEKGEDIQLRRGTLIVLSKPGKPPGLLSSLMPIVLLNTIRKTLSSITLNRIRPIVEPFRHNQPAKAP